MLKLKPVQFQKQLLKNIIYLYFSKMGSKSPSKHLEILSELAEFLSDKSNREALMAAESAGEVLQRVQTWEPARRSLS